MRNGFRIVDIDTHVNPSYDTLVTYLDPAARARVAELQPFDRTREGGARVLHVAPYLFEGPAMTKAVIDILGSDVLMHQSDYPHGEAHFPDTAQMVLDWPIWQDLGRDTLQRHMAGNAEKFLRLA